MPDPNLYAIVDIEATAGSLGTDERMIQFACILLEDGQVVEEFDTLVNPLRPVPIRIQKLTGISQKEVNQAPHFDEVAHIIHDLLEDAVFVAHNVNFDYRFLNERFEAVGLEPLQTKAIDTVALSRICFPQADHYNLTDLTTWLGYDIEQAHDALYDARATAFLLDKIIGKLASLPLLTLKQVSDLSQGLAQDTQWLIDQAYNQVKDQSPDLENGLVFYEGLAIKDPKKSFDIRLSRSLKDYPLTDRDKAKFFAKSFRLRQRQGDLMDQIYYYFNKDKENEELAIEAPAGIGKSLAYLVPSVFVGKPVVISTHTRTLQDQLLEEALPFMEQVSPLKPKVLVFKGCHHYLSLTRFSQALKSVSSGDSAAMIAMQVLVWLTETETGDVDELNIDSLNHPFWQAIITRYSQLPLLSDQDFYKRLVRQAKSADIVITNHAHLITDLNRMPGQRVLPNFDHLIIDEAQHLAKVTGGLAQSSLNKSKITRLLRALGDYSSDGTLIDRMEDYTQRRWLSQAQIHRLVTCRSRLAEAVSYFFDLFIPSLEMEGRQGWLEEVIDDPEAIADLDQTKRLGICLNQLIQELQTIYQDLKGYQDAFVKSDHLLLEDLFTISNQLSDFYRDFNKLFGPYGSDRLIWIEAYASSLDTSIRLKSFSQGKKSQLLANLHAISHVIYISSTLSVNQSVAFFEKQVQAKNLKYLAYLSPYQVKDQAQILVPKDLVPVKKFSNQHLVHHLVTQIVTMMKNLNRKTLILFHSHEVLQEVYHTLTASGLLSDYALLAQDLSGSRYKILKQFKRAKKSILFGSDTFFEGIDLPGEFLEVVILTRLPFDSPDMPLVKDEHQRMKEEGMNIFKDDLLPRAVIKTKQAYGRLIRSEKDRGVFVILDDRFLHANYASIFQQSLPVGENYKRCLLKDLPQAVNRFLGEACDLQ